MNNMRAKRNDNLKVGNSFGYKNKRYERGKKIPRCKVKKGQNSIKW
jgi:hypothetical protein